MNLRCTCRGRAPRVPRGHGGLQAQPRVVEPCGWQLSLCSVVTSPCQRGPLNPCRRRRAASALRGKAWQHLVAKALDGLERIRERHVWPLVAHDEFLYPDRLIACNLRRTLCGAANDEAIGENLLERHVDAVSRREQAIV